MVGKIKANTKLNVTIVFVIVCLVAVTLPLYAQEDVMVLPGREPATLQRPAVTFSHARHAEELECLRCHHDYDAMGNNTGGDGQSCADCHTPSGGENPIPLTLAFHMQCKGCHQDLNTAGGKALPVMCGQCHIR